MIRAYLARSRRAQATGTSPDRVRSSRAQPGALVSLWKTGIGCRHFEDCHGYAQRTVRATAEPAVITRAQQPVPALLMTVPAMCASRFRDRGLRGNPDRGGASAVDPVALGGDGRKPTPRRVDSRARTPAPNHRAQNEGRASCGAARTPPSRLRPSNVNGRRPERASHYPPRSVRNVPARRHQVFELLTHASTSDGDPGRSRSLPHEPMRRASFCVTAATHRADARPSDTPLLPVQCNRPGHHVGRTLLRLPTSIRLSRYFDSLKPRSNARVSSRHLRRYRRQLRLGRHPDPAPALLSVGAQHHRRHVRRPEVRPTARRRLRARLRTC